MWYKVSYITNTLCLNLLELLNDKVIKTYTKILTKNKIQFFEYDKCEHVMSNAARSCNVDDPINQYSCYKLVVCCMDVQLIVYVVQTLSLTLCNHPSNSWHLFICQILAFSTIFPPRYLKVWI